MQINPIIHALVVLMALCAGLVFATYQLLLLREVSHQVAAAETVYQESIKSLAPLLGPRPPMASVPLSAEEIDTVSRRITDGEAARIRREQSLWVVELDSGDPEILKRVEALALDGWVPLTMDVTIEASTANWTLEFLAR